MSGLKNEPIQGGKFLNFKDGKIISAESGVKTEFTHLEGTLTDLAIVDDEIKGKKYRKIILFVIDDEENIYKLGFPLESGYGNAFSCLALNIDFSQPVKISGGIKEMDNDKTYGMLFIKQPDGVAGDWKNLKWHYNKESKELPQPEKRRDRSGEYMDYSERNKFFETLLTDTIAPAIKAAYELFQNPKAETVTKEETKTNKAKAKK